MPKVLITNGVEEGTWYQGMEGTAWDVAKIEPSVYMLKSQKYGDSRGVSKEDGELLYTQAEYRELSEINDYIQRQRDKAIDDLAKHAQTIVDLQNEKQMLLQQIERAVDEQKVELPWEVAEAIEFCLDQWKGFSEISVFGWFLDISKFDSSKVGMAIKEFARIRPLDYMRALVNGYTVELSPRDKVKQLIEKWYTDPGDVTDAELYELSDGIIELLQKSS